MAATGTRPVTSVGVREDLLAEGIQGLEVEQVLVDEQ